MNPSDDREEPGRNAALLGCLAIAIAFTAAAWDRLSLPFSTGEARFVHQALRESGQVGSPDFCADPNRVPAQILVVVQQLVGSSERALRSAMLVLLFASGWFLAEIVPGRSRLRFFMPFLIILARVSVSLQLSPQLLVVLPAALALLASPIGVPVTKLRALLGLAGSLTLGSIGFEAAFPFAVALAAICLLRGSILGRVGGIATAAAGTALAWFLHGRPELHLPSIRLSEVWTDHWSSLVLPGIILASLFVRDGFRRDRLALAFGWVLGFLAFASVVGPIEILPLHVPSEQCDFGALAFSVLTPLLWILLGSALTSFRPLGIIVVMLGILFILSGLLDSEARKDATATTVLAQARAVSQPGAALAVSGEDRVAVAVYARLGNAPMMPIAYVPETVPPDGLAKWCRDRGIRQLWIHPPVPDAPPGFSAPASRPAAVTLLMPLVVEGS
jgi:hypothetical protein